jgi:hypothetical protein
MKEENHNISRIVYVFKLVANDVAAIFPYFLAFYLISLLVSIFFIAWRGYFNWSAFHFSAIFFTLISLWSERAKNFWKGVEEISRRNGNKAFGITSRGATIIGKGIFLLRKFSVITFYVVIIPVKEKILFWKRNLGYRGYIKLAVIVVVLLFSLFQGIYVLDFFILLFGLMSILFGLDTRISAGCALALLVICPFLLVFNQNIFAETVAVYAYYFLIIAVFTGLGDCMSHPRVQLL